MPIYEYQAIDPDKSCANCRERFDAIQGIDDKSIVSCPACGGKVKKIISWCHAAIVEGSKESNRVEHEIKAYEQKGMWSQAAELADTHSEKTKDTRLKMRALENYKKAGYSADTIDEHKKSTNA